MSLSPHIPAASIDRITMKTEDTEEKKKTVFLCGLKSCGKTTIANAVAEHAGCIWIDCDDEILKRNPQYKSCREMFRSVGEPSFRKEESLAVQAAIKQCKAKEEMAIVSLGGGACDADNVLTTAKANGILVYLQQSEHVLFERMNAKGLPAYLNESDAKQQFHELYLRRNEIYSCFADYVLQLSDCTKEEAVESVCRMFAER